MRYSCRFCPGFDPGLPRVKSGVRPGLVEDWVAEVDGCGAWVTGNVKVWRGTGDGLGECGAGLVQV